MFGFIESKAERAELSHNSLEYHHPLHEIAYNFNSGDCRPGATIVAYLNGLNDSRISSYLQQPMTVNIMAYVLVSQQAI